VRVRCPHLTLDPAGQILEFRPMPTRKRFPLKGPAMAFITTSVYEWIPVFQDKECSLCVLKQLKETVDHFKISLAAYVIMPTHIHFLAGFKEIEKLSKVMQSFKILTSKKLKLLLSDGMKSNFLFTGHFRLWQDRFDDVIIWSEKQFKIKIEYIHNNPIKAGLAESAVDFDYSSAKDWLGNKPGIIPIDKDWTWQK